jgi:hypothetical protein
MEQPDVCTGGEDRWQWEYFAPKCSLLRTQVPICSCLGARLAKEASAPFNIDLTNGTINTGKGATPAEVKSRTVNWREEGVLRTINRDSYAMFRQLPDGSFFQIGTCRPLEK